MRGAGLSWRSRKYPFLAAHKAVDDTDRSVGRSLPVHASRIAAMREAICSGLTGFVPPR